MEGIVDYRFRSQSQLLGRDTLNPKKGIIEVSRSNIYVVYNAGTNPYRLIDFLIESRL
jgi:hypothetical protein